MNARISSLYIVILTAVTLLCGCKSQQANSGHPVSDIARNENIIKELRSLGLVVREIPNEHADNTISETFEVMITQPLDHQEPSRGTFQQKFYLSHVSTSAPMVMYLSGYNANDNRYLSEPARILTGNQIHVEHRFFGDSAPVDIPYEFLTIHQAAADHHAITEVLKQVYSGPWVNTGISKGGQTTMYHRYLYPNDVDASVVYVAPLNQDREDERIYDFLAHVGQKECRDRVLAYQMELLLNYDQALSFFEEKTAAKGYRYRHSMKKTFELSVFEYGFAFWQWSADCDAIPAPASSVEEKVDHLFTIDAPGFFTESTMTDIFPFFYQSYTEMGMYGYKVDAFAGLTQEYTEDFSNYRTFIPEGFELTYDGTTHRKVEEWLDTEAEDIIFIYGEYDPWSATSYEPSGQNNLIRFTIPEGNHASRLAHLDKAQVRQFKDSLYTWIQLKEN